MATIESLGKKYAEYLEDNYYSPTIVEDIIKRINSITYTEGESLSDIDKTKLIDSIESHYNAKIRPALESEDSTDFISMIKAVRKEVKNG